MDLAEASMTYHIVYELRGEEPTATSDVEHFARANGAYHSWPFVRETIFNLTAKMGFPPYTLPVLLFLPRHKPNAPASAPAASSQTAAPETAEAK
jgi:hypothetical protein